MQSTAFLVVTMIVNTCAGSASDRLHGFLQRGKPFLSRSSGIRVSDDPESVGFTPEHRLQLHSFELLEDDQALSNIQLENLPPHSQAQPNQRGSNLKEKATGHEYLYRTDIIKKDNMDLYGLIGGLSFASLIVTTLLILGRNRRNGIFAKSLGSIFRLEELDEDIPHKYLSFKVEPSAYLSQVQPTLKKRSY